MGEPEPGASDRAAAEPVTLTDAERAYANRAKQAYQDDDIDFDETPTVSESASGAWVSAWVWVDAEQA